MVLRQLTLHIEKDRSLPHTMSKNNSRQNKDIYLKDKALEHLEEYIEVCFYELGRGKHFLNKTKKPQITKKKW